MSISQIEIDSEVLSESIEEVHKNIHDLMKKHSEISETVKRSEYESFADLLERKQNEFRSFKLDFMLKQQKIQHNFDLTLKSYDKILHTIDMFRIQNNNAHISTLQSLSLAVINKNYIPQSDFISGQALENARFNEKNKTKSVKK